MIGATVVLVVIEQWSDNGSNGSCSGRPFGFFSPSEPLDAWQTAGINSKPLTRFKNLGYRVHLTLKSQDHPQKAKALKP